MSDLKKSGSILAKFVNFGIYEENDIQLNKCIWILNMFAITAGLTVLTYSILFFILGKNIFGFFMLLYGLWHFFLPFFNRWKLYNLSRIFLVISGNLLIFILAVTLGEESGMHLFFLTAIAIPFLIFRFNEWIKLIFGCSLPLINLLMLAWYYKNYSIIIIPLNESIYGLLYASVYFSTYLLLISMVAYFFYSGYRAIGEVKKSNELLKEEKRKVIQKNTLLNTTLEQLKSTQAQLLQQEKLASIGQLAAGVAHELNNPLGFVNGNFAALKDYFIIINEYIQLNESLIEEYLSKHKDKIEEFKISNDLDFIFEDIEMLFNESEDGIERAINIVKNLKEFSRIDDEKAEDFDLIKGIKNTLTIAKNEYKYCAEVETELEDLPIIKANGGEINEVILNIVVNAAQAIKSMDLKEKKHIKIKTYKDEEYVYCKIEDNGPGIPEKIIEKIFDPFFTTKAIGEGTGLGLNISYNIIVKKHKGDLSVKSKIGKGSKFTIKLPIS